ncbi:TonB-dependent receptor domain-containing protein [Chitinibacter sp. GC72]|uniref:TonB-dependent receptor domain-containing protein n=1 Tax=Chitinibacter sp. GC72 TaxID=1526917 RepID=UPI0018DF59A2|nr:TonB-dependent receptor [Chitinibacter sp. GC72]
MNTRFSKLYLVCLSALSAMAHAEITQLDEIVVTAARIAQPAREVVGDVTVIERAQIETQASASLPELLARQPGLQMMSNGGAGKNMAVFIRGANSSQTVVLIDGVRYGSATSGGAALQHIPLAQVDRIEILRGPAASLYGADAIGGVIQIFTKRGGKGFTPSMAVGYGTQNSVEASASFSGGNEQTRYAIGVAHSKTDGGSALVLPKYQKFNADDDGYENNSLSLSASHQLNAANAFGANLLYAKVANQYDNTSTSKYYDYRDHGTNLAASVWSEHQLTDAWQSKLLAGTSIDDSYSYQPPSAWAKEESRFKTRQTQLSWQNNLQAGPGVLTLALETLAQNVAGTTKYDVTQRRINSVLGGYLANLGAVTLQANVRSDDNSQFGRQTTGTLGASWQVNHGLQLGGSYGTGYQAPTFNQLYYPGWSNPHLKPQESAGGELFARYQTSSLQLGATVYRNQVKNFILNQQNHIANVDKVKLSGLTLTADWASDGFEAGLSFDYLDALDQKADRQLELRARQSGLIYAGFSQSAWRVRTEVQLQGQRYDDVYGVGRVTLGGYALTHLLAEYQLSKDWTLAARVNNVFDKTYTQVYDYGTLGVNGMLNVRWSPK